MQDNVDIGTCEKDLCIIYGTQDRKRLSELQEKERELARSSFKYLATDVLDIKNSYIRLGFHLSECKSLGYYSDFGFDSLEEFVAVNFGLDKSALSRCLNVYYKFSFCQSGHSKMCIDDKYSAYSYSQLCEMVSMDDAHLREVKPEMTVKELRELKKRVIDIAPEKIKVLMESYRKKGKPFTRKYVLERMMEDGSSYSGGNYLGFDISFFPGKVSIDNSSRYFFKNILDEYEHFGNVFEEELPVDEVATSQPSIPTLFRDDLHSLRGAALSARIKKAVPLHDGQNLIISVFDAAGKKLNDMECVMLVEDYEGYIFRLVPKDAEKG